jgi:anti-anti-sigma factor
MAVDWSDNIVLAQLNDEPMLSDELGSLIERLEKSSVEVKPKGRKQTPHVVLDFGGVSYINSSNIAQLLRLKRSLDSSGRQLRLCAMGDEVWSVMMVTGLEKVFRFAPDTLSALAGLQLDEAPDSGDEDAERTQ